jgi:hypothetical protein
MRMLSPVDNQRHLLCRRDNTEEPAWDTMMQPLRQWLRYFFKTVNFGPQISLQLVEVFVSMGFALTMFSSWVKRDDKVPINKGMSIFLLFFALISLLFG